MLSYLALSFAEDLQARGIDRHVQGLASRATRDHHLQLLLSPAQRRVIGYRKPSIPISLANDANSAFVARSGS